MVDTLRRPNQREKKPVPYLQAVESWRVLIAHVEGFVQAFDLNTYRPMATLSETRGATIFTIHERSHLLCAVTKKKISVRVVLFFPPPFIHAFNDYFHPRPLLGRARAS